MAQNPTLTITPTHAFFRPGDPVTLTVAASAGATVEATITHLADPVATLSAALDNAGRAVLTWQPPADAPVGYGVDARLLDANGAAVARASTAFDVLDRWIQAPRYGFLSEFAPGRSNAAATMDALLRYHVNGLQFYDWQYRHAELMPPTDPYADVLGRQLSLETVTGLIDAAHARNIAAMPYTAIYGAAPDFAAAHPDWVLLDAKGEVFDFANGFLKIMNPDPASPWSDHLLREFAAVLDNTTFDGIHLDQYGAPKVGYSTDGTRVDLAEAFPGFIDRMAALVDDKRGPDGVSIFNAVGNWPVETVAPAGQDAVYIEVWEPYTRFTDLPRIVTNAQALGGGKPVIIAAYIHPDWVHNVLLSNALIGGSGGTHLELGEPDAMLADPYFPEFGVMDAAMQAAIARYYDFVVRYENVLSIGTTDAPDRAQALTVEGVRTSGLRAQDRLVVLARDAGEYEALSLVNLVGISGGRWDQQLVNGPTPLTDLAVRLDITRPVTAVYWASPDEADPALQALDFTVTDGALSVTLPRLAYWDLLLVQYAGPADTGAGA